MILTLNNPRVRAISFGPLIVFRDHKIAADPIVNRHETIHFFQQAEMAFIPMWLLYMYFYVRGRIAGLNHWQAYRYNPFEIEAYNNERDPDYLRSRKPYAWTKYIHP